MARRLLILVLVFLAACDNEPTAPPAVAVTEGTPIILVSIDTLRADRLPAYGYAGVETPAIDALRRDGILYEHAYSHIPLTLPAHSSILTGLLPGAHSLRDNIGYRLDAERVAAGEIPFLPLALQERGYQTGAAVSTYVLRSRMGLDFGFDFYEDSIEFRSGVGLGGMQRPGGLTLDLARDWLRRVADDPFFFFFHIYEPHTPYRPPEPYASRYASAYDGEVATADRVVGDLFDELKSLGVYDRALIVLLSDHGEGLGEHGEDEHGVLLYKTTLQVPLLLKLPYSERAGETVTVPVQLIDVFPTVAEVLDLDVQAEMPGTSLLRLFGADAPRRRIFAETFYPRLHFGWSELTSLIDGEHHYIFGPDPELYDLTVDPGELTNVLREKRSVLADFRADLESYDTTLQAPAAEDEETRRALAALGYVGTTTSADLSGPLPDPKSRLHTLDDLQAGFRFHSQGDYEQAAEAFRGALVDNPEMLDAWEFLGQSLRKLGRYDEALEAYRKALEISSGASHLAVAVASLFFDLGRFDDAEDHARLALTSHPSFAHGLLARIAFRRDDLDLAESEARLALDGENRRLGPSITLAGVLHGQGRFEEGLEVIHGAEAIWAAREDQDQDLIRGLHLQKGKLLADLGRVGEAEAAFAREIELVPDQIYAYSNLAVLYALSGRPNAVGPLLRRMVEARPAAAAYAEAVRTLRALDTPGADGLLRYALGLYPDDEELLELR